MLTKRFVVGSLLSLCVLGIHCTKRRDTELRQLYSDGTRYLKETRARLEKIRNADEAAAVAEEVLPELEKLVLRKQELERKYPEIGNMEKRESIHGKFPEFIQFREEFRSFYKFGGMLWKKYQDHPRYAAAVRRAFGYLAYF